ncbi:MAG: citrate (Si)-synthase [Candidatus Delongbacteria bacterium]|nr:citrate (Si)-synthase [Candidatus Delongbacteria bacterium]
MKLKERLAAQIPEARERYRKLMKEYGEVKIADVTAGQLGGGMRGIKSLLTDISYLDPEEGIRFRGYTIPETLEKLPRREGAEIPLVGGFYYLLLTGEIPTLEEAEEVEADWQNRSAVPQYIFDTLSQSEDVHPMTLFSVGVLMLQKESVFARNYATGMKKEDYWDAMYEDSMNMLAKLPTIAAFIYQRKYKNSAPLDSDPSLDWGSNFAHLMNVSDPEYKELAKLYFILHSDHESGNVSAHTSHLVASALSDVYYSWSAGLCGLAGPLHGLANQECLRWVMGVYEQFDGVPTEEQIHKFAWDTLNSGQVIPGYGHAVLRKTDPRYTAQREFALKHMPEDDLFKTMNVVYNVVPPILKEHGKAKNPWPNVDAHSGVLQYFYGVTEFDFYTVMFGIGRALGISANLIWDRAVGQPLERPKSITTDMLEKMVKNG